MSSRTWKTDDLEELVGSQGACELLGISRMTLHRWMKPGSGEHGPKRTYMIEWKSIASGPIWAKQDVLDFAAMNPRKRAKAEPREGVQK